MNLQEVMTELENYGDEQTKKTLMRHGAKEPIFGVKVADLKNILKKTKKNHELSLQLYDTGNSDAMYLAGLMADENTITKEQLEKWVEKAYWSYLSEFTVPWVAGESPYGFELGLKWIESDNENIASAGWSTLSSYANTREDSVLDLNEYSKLIDKVISEIDKAPNRVRYTMNGFIISIGASVKDLTEKAITAANTIGQVTVDMQGTDCKVPLASDYILKSVITGRAYKKRKTARC
ncbi:MAG: DNA alkylation repair protein [Saprospiraceae bacterium]|nr:DNA alkylation repair protein [Saprospiraceae bacterium]